MALTSMPSQDILNVVREKGMLAKQLYLVATEPTGDLDAIMPVLEAHLEYQIKLEREGHLFAAGPNWTEDEQSWTGSGTVVLRATDMAQARALMEADPMHSSGARTFSIRPWLVDEGRLTIELSYSDGTFKMR